MTTKVVIREAIAGNADPQYNLADFSFRPLEVVELDDALAAAWIASGRAAPHDEFMASIPVTPGEAPPAPEPIAPMPPPGFVADPSETNEVQWPVAIDATDIAFLTVPTTVVIDSVFLIDAEYMTVNDVSNVDNPGVARGTYDSIAAEHDPGVTIYIWAPETGTLSASSASKTRSAGKKR